MIRYCRWAHLKLLLRSLLLLVAVELLYVLSRRCLILDWILLLRFLFISNWIFKTYLIKSEIVSISSLLRDLLLLKILFWLVCKLRLVRLRFWELLLLNLLLLLIVNRLELLLILRRWCTWSFSIFINEEIIARAILLSIKNWTL